MKNIVTVFIVFGLLTATSLSAREIGDTTQTDERKDIPEIPVPLHRNIIKFNPTPMVLTGMEIRNITFSYERLISNNTSVAFLAGYLVFPRLVDDTLLNLAVINTRVKNGINLAFDYRYYPFQRNARPAPDGLYLGGYLSYYGYQFNHDITVLSSSGDPNGSLFGKVNIVNLGMELGYQFVFWKRFTVDLLLFGPSLSLMSTKLAIEGQFSAEQLENLDEEMVKKLKEKFPYLGILLSDESLEFNGTRTTIGMGFRYSIQLGFHF